MKKAQSEGMVPIIGMDYVRVRSSEGEGHADHRGKEQQNEDDRGEGGAERGVVDNAVEVAKRFIEQLGYKMATLKSDNEPTILSLKETVRRETDVEEAPVEDHQANGLAENAAMNGRASSGFIKMH